MPAYEFRRGFCTLVLFIHIVNEVDLPFYCLLMIHRTSDGRGCANVGIEQEVQFNVTVTMDQCLSGIQR